jgi:1-acyl-sn-glycerol-3-phosphate acyltransferase
VLLFPEGGIVGNGEEPATFHPMFFGAALKAEAPVSAAALCYIEPADRSVWAWLEGEHPAHHLRYNLLPADYVKMTLVFGAPIPPARFPGRKELAAGAQEEVSRLWRDEKNPERPAA